MRRTSDSHEVLFSYAYLGKVDVNRPFNMLELFIYNTFLKMRSPLKKNRRNNRSF